MRREINQALLSLPLLSRLQTPWNSPSDFFQALGSLFWGDHHHPAELFGYCWHLLSHTLWAELLCQRWSWVDSKSLSGPANGAGPGPPPSVGRTQPVGVLTGTLTGPLPFQMRL